MIVIYKITNPNGKVYIGQTTNYEKRLKSYKRLNCKGQKKLYSSFIKYGVENHKFEIITECNLNELNELERYYQDLYNCIGKNGLNLILTKTNDKSGYFSEEVRIKMSELKKLSYIKKGHIKKPKIWSKNVKVYLDMNTGIYYTSIKEFAKLYPYPDNLIKRMVNGLVPNKLPIKKV